MSFVISSLGDFKGANVVSLGAPKLVLNTVKLYNSGPYTVNPSDTVPPGTPVYTGSVLSVNLLSSTTAEVLVQIETTLTARTFRTVALFDSDGDLYCTHAYSVAQVQMARNTEQGHRFVLRCHVKPPQGIQVLAINNASFDGPAVASSMSAVPPVSTVGCVLVLDATGYTLHMCSDGTKWTLDGHVVVRESTNVSSVSTVGGKTVFTAPGFDTNVPTTSVGRYVVVGPGQKVARVESITGSSVKLNGSYAWVTLGSSLTIWEDYGFRVRTHPQQPNPHTMYLSEVLSDGRYARSSHVTDSNPHNQYLSDDVADTSYAPSSHQTAGDPHTQYALKTFMLSSYLSSLTNTDVVDAGGQTRFRFNAAGPTFLYGGKLTSTASALNIYQPDLQLNAATFAFTSLGSTSTAKVYNARFKGGKTVALTSSRYVYRSADNGITWTNQAMTDYTSAAWASWWGLAYEATHLACTSRFFVAFTDQPGLFSTSTDGEAWTLRNDTNIPAGWSSTPRKVLCSAWSGSYLVVGGERGMIASSPDGLAWTYSTLSASSWLANIGGSDSISVTGVCWNGVQFTAVGYRGRVTTSLNLSDWTYVNSLSLTTWGLTNARCCAANMQTGQVLVGGDLGKISLSTNNTASSWTDKTTGLAATAWGTKTVFSVCHNGSFWLLGGDQGALAWSIDGTTWTYLPALSASPWGNNPVRHIEWTGRRFLLSGDNQKFAAFPGTDQALSTQADTWTPLLTSPRSKELSYSSNSLIPYHDSSKTVPSTAWVYDTYVRPKVIERYIDSSGTVPPELALTNFNEMHVYRVNDKRSLLVNTVMAENAVYEMHYVATTRLENSDMTLTPNDTNYGNVISSSWIVHHGDTGLVSGTGFTPHFRVGAGSNTGRHPTGKFVIDTQRSCKTTRATCQDTAGAGQAAALWHDTTTQWRVVGRLSTEQALADNVDTGWSWYVSIRRIL